MKYPFNFSEDMKYLSNYYKWNEEAKTQVRASFADCEPMVRFYTILAQAHRAGYSQHAGNGFQRLKDWCAEKGLGDPYGKDFDLKALDDLVV